MTISKEANLPAPPPAMRPLSLRTNFSWTFIGNVVYSGCQWGMLVILAKLTSPEQVGQFALGLAIATPVIMFTNLRLRSIQATDAQREYAFGHYVGLRLITTVLAMLLIAGIVLVAGYKTETMLVVLFVGLAKGFEAFSDVFYGLFQQRERMDRIAISMIIKGVVSLMVLGVGVYTSGIIGGVIGLAAAWAIVLVLYDIRTGVRLLHSQDSDPIADHVRPRWEKHTLLTLAWLTLPLGIVRMLIALNTNIPRYFISWHMGERELGVFAAIAYLMVAGMTVEAALSQSASPKLAKYYVEKRKAPLRKLVLKLLGIDVLLAIGGVGAALIAGRQILTVFYEAEYAEYQNIFTGIMVVAGIWYVASLMNYVMTATRYLKVQLPIFILVTGVTAAMCWWLVPEHGLTGAVIALLASAIVQVICGGAAVLWAIHRMEDLAHG